MEMWKVKCSVEVEVGCHGDIESEVFCRSRGGLSWRCGK